MSGKNPGYKIKNLIFHFNYDLVHYSIKMEIKTNKVKSKLVISKKASQASFKELQ